MVFIFILNFLPDWKVRVSGTTWLSLPSVSLENTFVLHASKEMKSA
jgi:hypothetical protein